MRLSDGKLRKLQVDRGGHVDLLQLLTRDLAIGLGLTGLVVSPAFGYAVGFPILGMNDFAQVWHDPAAALVHGDAARPGRTRPRIRRRHCP